MPFFLALIHSDTSCNVHKDMYSDKIEHYNTKNLNLAAYLSCYKEIQFTGATKISNEFFFKFTPKNKAEELVNQYFAGNASINPRELFARLHDLKDLIFSQKGDK